MAAAFTAAVGVCLLLRRSSIPGAWRHGMLLPSTISCLPRRTSYLRRALPRQRGNQHAVARCTDWDLTLSRILDVAKPSACTTLNTVPLRTPIRSESIQPYTLRNDIFPCSFDTQFLWPEDSLIHQVQPFSGTTHLCLEERNRRKISLLIAS